MVPFLEELAINLVGEDKHINQINYVTTLNIITEIGTKRFLKG